MKMEKAAVVVEVVEVIYGCTFIQKYSAILVSAVVSNIILYRSLESGSNHLIIIGGLNENSKNKNR